MDLPNSMLATTGNSSFATNRTRSGNCLRSTGQHRYGFPDLRKDEQLIDIDIMVKF